MNAERFEQITQAYGRLKVVVAGDFCLDRYLEIDPALEEISLETGLAAHQVVGVRSQGGGAGNVLTNVAALHPAAVRAVGICGQDGEGFELLRALRGLKADLSGFLRARGRLTFTYTKPLVCPAGGMPRELSRLDIKTRTPLTARQEKQVVDRLEAAMADADAVILMDQASDVRLSVLNSSVKAALAELAARPEHRGKVILADSRTDCAGFASVGIKVNRQELFSRFSGQADATEDSLAARWAAELGHPVFVTLSEQGMIGALPDGTTRRVGGVCVEGPIDVVGAGDAVLAHLAVALAAGAELEEAMTLANLAGSIVVKKIGTTGTAGVDELRQAIEKRG